MQSFYKNMGYDTATGNKLASEAWKIIKQHFRSDNEQVNRAVAVAQLSEFGAHMVAPTKEGAAVIG